MNCSTRAEMDSQHYDQLYGNGNAFHYRQWLYRPLVRALVRKADLVAGSAILDVGCGQGLFSHLFAECGMKAHGVDISSVGVKSAHVTHGSSGPVFLVADATRLPFQKERFDCVFTRSCSLYNTSNFPFNSEMTKMLLEYIKPAGVFVFLYNTRLSATKKSSNWRYHNLDEVRQHFGRSASSRIYFSLRVELMILGAWGLNPLTSTWNALVSKLTGAGGEIVVLARK